MKLSNITDVEVNGLQDELNIEVNYSFILIEGNNRSVLALRSTRTKYNDGYMVFDQLICLDTNVYMTKLNNIINDCREHKLLLSYYGMIEKAVTDTYEEDADSLNDDAYKLIYYGDYVTDMKTYESKPRKVCDDYFGVINVEFVPHWKFLGCVKKDNIRLKR